MASAKKPVEANADALPDDAPYEKLVERLEQVVERLDAGDLPLEESVRYFKEGTDLLKRAEEKLRAAERRVEELLEDGRTAPLEPGRSEAPRPKKPGPAADDVPF